jgi:uncharacterized protein (DUF924 family)
MDKSILSDIHAFWFGDLKADDDFPKDKAAIWFNVTDATDAAIRDRFGGYLDEARIANWNLSSLSRREAIALVVLLDQFPRNIFRTSGEAFAYDEKARDIARRLVASGPDKFFWVERTFLFLPFEHSEDAADQDRSVMYYAELAVTAPETLLGYMRGNLDYATKHRDIIRRFGRFPHRNAMLGRTSTPEELAFLKEHGRGY